jgi:hypothetical protein
MGGELVADVPFKLMHPAPGIYKYIHWNTNRLCSNVWFFFKKRLGYVSRQGQVD